MRRRAGQALRWTRRLIHLVVPAVLLVGLVAAWRLAQGPLPVPMIARQIERAVAAEGGVRLEIGDAAITWEGFRSGSAAPLDIRLERVTLRDAAGALRADLPEVAVTLSMRALLQGRLAPASVELRRPSLLLSREADGSFSLGAGMAIGGGEAPEAAAPEPGGMPVAAMIAALHRSAGEEGARILASFRRLRIQGGEVLVQDRRLDRRWSLDSAGIDIRRGPRGGLSAEGSARVETLGMEVPVRLAAFMPEAEPARLTAELVLPALRPAELAVLWPELAPLRVLDVPIALGASASIDAAGGPARAEARLIGGAGALDFGQGQRLPFAGIGATVTGEEGLLRLASATLRLPGTPEPMLHASGEARRGAEGWTAELQVSLPALSLEALPGLWPAGLAAEARGPVLAVLAAGRLRDLRLGVAITAGADFTGLAFRQARAGFALEQAELALGAAAALTGAEGLAPSARVMAERLGFEATATPERLTIERIDLRLPAPGEGAPVTAIAAAGEALRDPATGTWRGSATLGLDAVRLSDLPHLWPEGLARNARGWITENLTAGTVRDGQWQVEGVLAPGMAGPDVTRLTGSAGIQDATVHWLRPIPPIQGIAGTASFSLPEITIRTHGGRQLVVAPPADATRAARNAAVQRAARQPAPAPPPRLDAGIDVREATIRLSDLEGEPSRADIDVSLAGGLPEVMTLLRHPRLHLFDRKPLEMAALAGHAEARLSVGLPMKKEVPVEEMRLRAAGRVTDAQLTEVLMGHALERGAFDFAVDLDGMRINGTGQMVGAPLRATVELDFRPGAATQVTERAQVSVARADARQLNLFGLDTAGLMEGTAAVEARYERRRNGQASVALRGDLREARLTFEGVGWQKSAGAPGSAEATLRMTGDALQSAEGLRIETHGLAATGRIAFGPNNRMERVEIAAGSRLGATQFGGTVTRPRREGGPWAVQLQGPLVDLQPILAGEAAIAEPTRVGRVDAVRPAGPEFDLDLRFERGTMGEGRNLLGLAFRADVDGRGLLRGLQASGRTGPQGAFQMALAPRGGERQLSLTALDGGAFLRALDLTDSISGGRLAVSGVYRELRPHAPLLGTAELDGFAVRNAPGLGKVLQAMTLYGVLEAMQGGNGLVFARAVVPFTLTPESLALHDGRAFSASLGLTAKGRILRRERQLDIEGTVVPAYFFNQLLGNIPLLGRLFSPERGGGVFAATYRMRGPTTDPTVSVNPLAALTPGFLRGIFGLAEGGRGAPVPNPTDR